jgi:MFS family permease
MVELLFCRRAILLYLFFNLGCGLAQTKGQMIAFRFLSGLGGSAPLALGGGVLSDLFTAEERGKAISIYSLAPLLGPAVGPVAGGFITENTTWRWVFYSTTIADALIQLSGLFFLQETYAPVLLHRKKKTLIKETGNEALFTEFDHPERTVAKTLRISLIRPFKLLGTQVIVQVLALYMAYLYGLMYLVLSTFPGLWENGYHESVGIGGFNYISLGVGFFLGTQSAPRVKTSSTARLKKRNDGVGKPEFRVPLMIPGALLVPIGLFIYGWTVNTTRTGSSRTSAQRSSPRASSSGSSVSRRISLMHTRGMRRVRWGCDGAEEFGGLRIPAFCAVYVC